LVINLIKLMVQATAGEQFDPNWTMFTKQQIFEPI